MAWKKTKLGSYAVRVRLSLEVKGVRAVGKAKRRQAAALHTDAWHMGSTARNGCATKTWLLNVTRAPGKHYGRTTTCPTIPKLSCNAQR